MNLPTIELGKPEPTIFHFIAKHVPIPYAEFFTTTIIVVIFLTLVVLRTVHDLERKDIGLWQALWELTVSGFSTFVEGIMGPGNERFVPLIGTLFIFILTMNLFGIIPGFISPTASLNTTISLALTVFVVVQVAGLRAHGPKHYFMHFVGDPVWLGPIMFPLHLIGELAKPLSLSLRLAGNVFAEDAVITIFAALSPFLYLVVRAEWAKSVPLFPMQIVILPLMLLFGVIQAFVFTMLSTIYISLMIGESGGDGHEAHA